MPPGSYGGGAKRCAPAAKKPNFSCSVPIRYSARGLRAGCQIARPAGAPIRSASYFPRRGWTLACSGLLERLAAFRSVHHCRAISMASPAMAAVSARRMRGPSETGCMKGAARSTSSSRGVKAAFGADQQGALCRPATGRAMRSNAAASVRSGGQSGEQVSQRPRARECRERQALALLGRLHRDGVSAGPC